MTHSDARPASPAHGDAGTDSLPDIRHITVVVLTYNRKESLRRTLEALLACDTEGLEAEVRIIDDGSRDGTGDMLREILLGYSGPMRLHYHYQENAGHSAAVNKSIAVTETELLLMLDDDMVPAPGWVRAMVSAPWAADVASVGGRIQSPETGTWVARYCRHRRYNEFPADDQPITFVNSGNAAYQRRTLEEIGGFENLLLLGGEDIEASWRLALAGYRVVYQPEAVTLHYHRETVQALYRTFWTRGYAQTVRGLIWKSMPPPTRQRVHSRRLRWYRSWFGLCRVPFEGFRLLSRGVQARDAWRFAYLTWARRLALRAGEVACLQAVLEGRQSLERSSRVPKASGNPGTPPIWARAEASAAE